LFLVMKLWVVVCVVVALTYPAGLAHLGRHSRRCRTDHRPTADDWEDGAGEESLNI
jgi:hypothetical protein